MDSFSSVPPHIQPPMAHVPSAIRELIKFVSAISMYSVIFVPSFFSNYFQLPTTAVLSTGIVHQLANASSGSIWLLSVNCDFSKQNSGKKKSDDKCKPIEFHFSIS